MSDGWHDDPLGRYAKRYHDGTNWTEHVSNGGTSEVDPLGIQPSPASAPAPPAYSAPPAYAAPAYAAPAHAAANGDGFPPGVELANPWIRLGSYLIEGILVVITLGIGWLIWALTTAGSGQTPAKKILGLRVVGAVDKRPVGLGTMFWMRGIVGGIVAQFVVLFTLGIILLMPLWDSRNQNIWDKISSTYVVQDPNDAWNTR